MENLAINWKNNH